MDRSFLGVWAPLPPLLAWIQWGGWWWLTIAAGGLLVALHASRSHRDRAAPALVLTIVAICAAAVGQATHDRLSTGWEGWWVERKAEVDGHLEGGMEALLQNADRAAVEVAAILSDSAVDPGAELRRVRSVTGVSALAVYDADGALVAWEGTHQGQVPDEARSGTLPFLYGDGPLFGYLYSTAPIPETGGVVVAAILMRADLPFRAGEGSGDFAGTFRDRIGEEIRISPADRVVGDGLDVRWEGNVLFSMEILPLSRSERLVAVRVLWGRVVGALCVLVWLFLLRWLGTRTGGVAGAAVLFLGATILPLGSLLGVTWLFAPAGYLLPGPGEITLGRLLALGLAAIVAAGILGRTTRWTSVPPGIHLLPVLIGFPLLLGILRKGASADFLAEGEGSWVAYQALVALGLTALARLALRSAPRPSGSGGGVVRTGLALGLAALLAIGLAELSRHQVPLPLWPAALWVIPALLASPALAMRRGRTPSPVAWLAAVCLGTSAALPYAWADRVDARMTVAEARMQTVGMRPDPYLEFLLNRLGDQAGALHAQGVRGVQLLVDGWVGSGVAAAGYPVRLTLWSPGGVPREELRIGVADPRPSIADNLVLGARPGPSALVQRFDLSDVHYLSIVSFPDSSAVTAIVPPLRSLGTPEPLGPLFVPEPEDGEPLTLIPLLPGEDTGRPDALRWLPVPAGWRGDAVLAYPEGLYRAQYALEFPPAGVALARGGLLLILNLLVVIVAWGFARLPRAVPPGREGHRRMMRALGSFRVRVTLVLFLFFMVPALAFGLQAYGTLEGAAQRTAEALARRAVDDAASAYLEVQGEVDLLARRVRADLLVYQGGSLVAGSPSELVDLGLFQGWLPGPAGQLLDGSHEVVASSTYDWGRWSYVVAYRRLPGGTVLAAVAPLRAGTAALRSREVADLLVFSLVLGGALSMGLALLAGRFLSRPIQVLQVASERVGSGNLRVRLPGERTDEFGEVFNAFNRMVTRLRRARRDLVRTSRRTRAIVEEVATGVVALDAEGTVALANPRAEALLGVRLEPGQRIPGGTGARDEFVAWVERAWRDGLPEAGTDLVMEGRRIRVRARRIARAGVAGGGGSVLSLEDVTDELRTERILAWGEMAQQVAHEVKNPLTPIKLAVQHIRRAWDDRRPDYDDILQRNVEAILREIDRLAGIARGFSRFGAPQVAGEAPLSPVRLATVVDELLALYAHGDGTVQFLGRVDGHLPPVRARESEMKEVLVNLLENARAAAAEGGEVVMEAEELSDVVEFRVRDNGAGIPPDLLARVFEPHFSTRSTGSGLGLAIVKRLVESWGGTVVAEAGGGTGTVIRILLRRWDEADEGPTTRSSPGRAGGTGDPG